MNENKKKEYSVVILFVVYIYTLIQISLIIRTSSACGSEIVLPWAIYKWMTFKCTTFGGKCYYEELQSLSF